LRPDEPDVLLVGGGGALDVVVVGAGVIGDGAHDIDSAATPNFTGRETSDSGVPGGTLTVKLTVVPPSSVTVTTHWSAAAGPAAISAAEPEITATMHANRAALRRLMI
jgi:hypothetical protein